MSKSVMISIQPHWCELIASGKKTLEVRKTRPKLETPFKCYIYCTYGKGLIERSDPFLPNMLIEQKVSKEKTWGNCCNGKVIGEFTCDRIYPISSTMGGAYRVYGLCPMPEIKELSQKAQMSLREMHDYLRADGGYGWHISDLVIYDTPCSLNKFRKPEFPTGLRYEDDAIKRPPQSWCYVEELKGGAE